MMITKKRKSILITVLQEYAREIKIIIISGGADGADSLGERYAM